MVRTARLSAALLLLAHLASGCGDDIEPSTATPSGVAQGAPDAPNVSIKGPANGSTVRPGNVKVRVAVTNFDVVDKVGRRAVEGEGHVHYYLDAEQIPTTPGEEAVLDNPRRYHAAARRSYTWKEVEPGTHNFAVQLVNNDHTPLDPPITAETTVEVERP